MKVQDVLLKAMAKKITWWEAAEIIGVTRPDHAALAGAVGGAWLFRPGRPPQGQKPATKRVPLATAEEVLRLYRETYYDLNIRHFHEKLREEHGIKLSYTWVQKALQGAGLVAAAEATRQASAAERAEADARHAAAH